MKSCPYDKYLKQTLAVLKLKIVPSNFAQISFSESIVFFFFFFNSPNNFVASRLNPITKLIVFNDFKCLDIFNCI